MSSSKDITLAEHLAEQSRSSIEACRRLEAKGQNVRVLYHADCADGFGAAWAVWKRYPRARFQAVRHGTQPPMDLDGRDVVVVDFCYPQAAMDYIREVARSVLVIDHHRTSRDYLETWAVAYSEGWLSYLDGGQLIGDSAAAVHSEARSGAALAWTFFHPHTSLPMLLRYIEDRDLWRWKMPESRAISAWIASRQLGDFEEFDAMDRSLTREATYAVAIIEGSAILRARTRLVEQIVANHWWEVVDDWRVPVVCAPWPLASEVGEMLLALHPTAAFAASFFQVPHVRVWSLRSTDDRADVAAIARERGGGGHRNAAGFRQIISEDPRG